MSEENENEDSVVANEEDSSSDGDFPVPAVENEDDSGEIEQQIDVPKEISFDSLIVDLSCHPKSNIIATGTIDGDIILHSYSNGEDGNKILKTLDYHEASCRAVCYSDSGECLLTGAQDGIIFGVDCTTNLPTRKFVRDNGSPIYSISPIDEFLMASGEDDGQVVLWDFRMPAPIQCFEDCEDYISSLVVNKEKKFLLATSGDGILSTYNIRRKKLEMQSEDLDCDLLCSGIFKGGTKVVVGAGDGSLNIFNWGEFGNISDRFPGHPDSVESMVVLGDDVICTGCEDGKIRAVQLFPNRFLGYLGIHSGFAVERLGLCHDLKWLVSASYDHKIKFWDLSGIEELRHQDVKETKKKNHQINKPVNDFYADLV